MAFMSLTLMAMMQVATLPNQLLARPESVYAVQQDADGLVVRVRSNGCTNAEDFAISTSRQADTIAITLQRLQPDHCRALLREGVLLKWTWAQLGIDESANLIVTNPLADR